MIVPLVGEKCQRLRVYGCIIQQRASRQLDDKDGDEHGRKRSEEGEGARLHELEAGVTKGC